ncbi:alpha/beta hydrolase family protein [Alteribacter keqinensis]|uniref:S9 family peptidase n=1 Tax=Alteribacter keqinensis TaxID=2483800 RepID=A0A3M7TT40_9BACI|nr:S9 family peptidase [Alteribacter keqinensis]RNA68786.1 S9 family peptidase [Alteribacter keqinensis]
MKRPIEIEDLKKITTLNEPQLSPDGEAIAYIKQTISEKDKYVSQLFVQKTGEKQAVQWTFGEERVSYPRFSPDGKWIVFLSNRAEKPQLFLLSTHGGEAKQLTTLKNGAMQPSWSPDSQRILFTTTLEPGEDLLSRPEEKPEDKENEPLVVTRLKYKSDASGFLDSKTKQLACYSLESDEAILLTEGDYNHEPGSWSPDGTKVTFFANKKEDQDYHIISDLYVLDVESKEETLLTDGEGIYTFPVFSHDGAKIAYYGHRKEYSGATHMKLWVMDMSTGESTCLTKDWDVNLGDTAIGDLRSGHPSPGPVWDLGNQKLYVTASVYGSTNLYSVTLDKEVSELVTGHHHIYGYDISPQHQKAVLAISTSVNPGDAFLVDLSSGEQTQLTDVNRTFLDEVHISAPEEVNFKADDGWNIHGWVMKPYGFEEGKKYPAILEIHGGPHAMYANSFFHEMQFLAAKGYVVLYTNPRGGHGYGQAFVDACRGDYGGKDYTDLMSAVDQAVEQFDYIEEDRLGVTGGSYGGFMTNWIVSHTDRFKAAATLRSISNWISFYGVSDIGYFFTEWEIGADLFTDPDKMWDHSPLKYVKDINTPLLILHGERDFRCPVEQAEQLFVALKHQKKETRLVRFPNANHELSRSGPPKLRYARLKELENWFNQYL